MKTVFLCALCLLVGVALGTIYGWRTGIVDGQIHSTVLPAHILQRYGDARGTSDIGSRDKVIDLLTMGLGTQVAVDNRFSPMSLFIQPKADATLIELAALPIQ